LLIGPFLLAIAIIIGNAGDIVSCAQSLPTTIALPPSPD
jgi:hypothetical protein